jgi:hypothetical protein
MKKFILSLVLILVFVEFIQSVPMDSWTYRSTNNGGEGNHDYDDETFYFESGPYGYGASKIGERMKIYIGK